MRYMSIGTYSQPATPRRTPHTFRLNPSLAPFMEPDIDKAFVNLHDHNPFLSTSSYSSGKHRPLLCSPSGTSYNQALGAAGSQTLRL